MGPSSRLAAVRPSASAMISQEAKRLVASGVDVIDLGLGEPDFDTPVHIVEAAYRAARSGDTRYPPTGGSAAMKAAVAEKFRADNDLTYGPDQIIVSNGAKQVIFDALMATIEPGDEVILCAPFFDAYQNTVALLGGVPVVVACQAESGFRMTPELLEAAITPRTRWLILNGPSNPAGAVYSQEALSALGDVLDRHPHVLTLSDEIYEQIIFDGVRFTSFAFANPALGERTLTVNGVSKSYAMTGWRIGYGAGPEWLIKAMTTVQSQISSGACSIAQAAAACALTGPQDCVADFRKAFERRRDLVVSAIAGIAGLHLRSPGGAFYALIDASDLIGATTRDGGVVKNDTALVEYLLAEAGIAAVPGSVYGTPGYFRISTACADELLASALTRIAGATSKLTPTLGDLT